MRKGEGSVREESEPGSNSVAVLSMRKGDAWKELKPGVTQSPGSMCDSAMSTKELNPNVT